MTDAGRGPDAGAAQQAAARVARLRGLEQANEATSNRLSTWRGVTFLAAAAAVVAKLVLSLPTAMWVVAGLFGATFVALVVAHAVVVTRAARLRVRRELAERSVARIDGDFAAGPRGEEFSEDPKHPYAGDLDVFGDASLFAAVCSSETTVGRRTLASWLLHGASAAVVAARQEAARELADKRAFCEELSALGKESGARAAPNSGAKPATVAADPLATWAAQPPAATPLRRRLPVVAGLALVPVTLAAAVAGTAFDAALGPWRHAWMFLFAIQTLLVLALRGATGPLLGVASSREVPFGGYLALLRHVESARFEAPLLAELRDAIAGASGADASRELARLDRIVGFAELRHNAILYVFVNPLLLWDVLCAIALERWRERVGTKVGSWIDALGAIDALASLGTFAHEHPDFAFPDVSDGPSLFEARALGHPLVSAKTRVANTVALVEPGTALLVTGSNMSGKSTLLRAMGVAAVLARAGAVVCASELRMSCLDVHTSMRVADSLRQGVSHFYAELARLHAVLEAAKRGEHVLFLLDEVLHGTNSRERQIGAKAIVLRLLERGGVGAVSSHDLGLADLEAVSAGRVRSVHFQEHVEDGEMRFDYVLRPGVVTSGNALRLMRTMGLDVDLPEPS